MANAQCHVCFFSQLFCPLASRKNGEWKCFLFQAGFITCLLLLQVVNTHTHIWPYLHINIKPQLLQFTSESHTSCRFCSTVQTKSTQRFSTIQKNKPWPNTGAWVLIYCPSSWAQVTLSVEFLHRCSQWVSSGFSGFLPKTCWYIH